MVQDNKPKGTVEFDIEDIPVIWHALNLQSSTDMFYGKEGIKASERNQQKANKLQEAYPYLCQHDIEEYGWLNAVVAARTCKEIKVSQKTEVDWNHYIDSDFTEKRISEDWLKTHPIIIEVDCISYKLTNGMKPYNKERLESLRKLLTQVIPLDSKLHEIDEPRLD